MRVTYFIRRLDEMKLSQEHIDALRRCAVEFNDDELHFDSNSECLKSISAQYGEYKPTEENSRWEKFFAARRVSSISRAGTPNISDVQQSVPQPTGSVAKPKSVNPTAIANPPAPQPQAMTQPVQPKKSCGGCKGRSIRG